MYLTSVNRFTNLFNMKYWKICNCVCLYCACEFASLHPYDIELPFMCHQCGRRGIDVNPDKCTGVNVYESPGLSIIELSDNPTVRAAGDTLLDAYKMLMMKVEMSHV